MQTRAKRNFYFILSDSHFLVSHRRQLAILTLQEFHQVTLVAPYGNTNSLLSDLFRRGLKFSPTRFSKDCPRVIDAVRTFFDAFRLALKERDGIFQLITVFSIVIFGLPLRLLSRRTIYTMSGLGTVFTTDTRKNRVIRGWLTRFYVFLFNGRNSIAIVQNKDDLNFFLNSGVKPNHIRMIPGSGVDPDEFPFEPYKHRAAEPTILVPARLIREKGILDALEASDLLIRRGISHKILFAGDIHPANPSSLSKNEIEHLSQKYPQARFLGQAVDMLSLYKSSWVVLLPSYREGLPKALLEAFAVGRPVVGYDVVGVRELVEHEKTGYLCKRNDKIGLADLISPILNYPENHSHNQIISKALETVHSKYSTTAINHSTVEVYHSI